MNEFVEVTQDLLLPVMLVHKLERIRLDGTEETGLRINRRLSLSIEHANFRIQHIAKPDATTSKPKDVHTLWCANSA